MRSTGLSAVSSSTQAEQVITIDKVEVLPKVNQSSLFERGVRAIFPGYLSGKNRTLVYAWTLSLLIVIALLLLIKSESSQFYGIVDGKAQSISFQYPVEIVEITVVEGEEVKQGSKLVKVKRNDLASKLTIIDDKITEIKLANQEYLATTKAKVKSLQAEQKAKHDELSTKINRLETRYKLNLKLDGKSTSNNKNKSKSVNVLVAEISGLKSSRWHTDQSYQAQIDNLNEQLQLDKRPATSQLAEFNKRKLELLRQNSALDVSAQFQGSIGSILYKAGETVEPFKPLMTLQMSKPDLIKGYIHESIINNIQIGQDVWVKSLSPKTVEAIVKAKVTSLGNRMIEYPDRLKRDKNVMAYGREVVIKLAQVSDLLQSEKVVILLKEPESLLAKLGLPQAELKNAIAFLSDIFSVAPALAEAEPVGSLVSMIDSTDYPETVIAAQQLGVITSKLKAFEPRLFEASGITHLKASDNYLVISDEVIDGQSSIVKMNKLGQIIGQLELVGGSSIADLESISDDGQYLYLAASLAYNKAGQLKPKRRLFIQAVNNGEQLMVKNEIDLFEKLSLFSELSSVNAATKKFLNNRLAQHNLEIESHDVVDNNLYLGLKSPRQSNQQTVILKISHLDQFLLGKLTDISIWKKFNLNNKNGVTDWFLTDLKFHQGSIYLLTVDRANKTNKAEQQSVVWSFNIKSNQLEERFVFNHRQAEGLSIDKDSKELVVVFDEGGKRESKFFVINY